MQNRLVFLLMPILLALVSCDLWISSDTDDVIARVGSNYLHKDEIEGLVPQGASDQDSTLIVNSYIENWAKEQLLLERAMFNLSESKQEELQALVESYRRDLFTEVYIEALVKSSMDTLVRVSEIGTFYQGNRENFKLNEDLLKLRYVRLNKNHYNFRDIVRKFRNFDKEDQEYLDSIALQFKAFSLNDSVWVRTDQVIQRIPPITFENIGQYLKKSQFFQLEDSIEVYLVLINDVRRRNEIAPLAYVTPTIRKIILNRRKLQFIKALEKDIIQDAVKNKQYQAYEHN